MTRPFKGLSINRGPEARYDAVVIGAGIGGLVCANLLAEAGARTLLVESHYMVGGYCSTFRRKGYVFDAASHFYPLLGNADTLTGKLLARLGVAARWVKMDPVDCFHFPDGSHFAVSADFDTYLADLKAAFPHQVESLDLFFKEARQAYMVGLLAYFRGVKTKTYQRIRELTVRDALDRHFQDPKLKLLLTADCPHWGSPPRDTSFVFDSMLRLSYFMGNYYPVGGSQAFADELARRFEELGGHILMKTQARRIAVENHRAVGVDLETGPRQNRRVVRVGAGVVVSNADLVQTLERLLAPKWVDPQQLAAVRRLRPSWPCYLTHIGLRGVDTATLERIQGYHWDSWDPDDMGRDGLRFKLFAPTLFEPRMAPPGEHVLIVQKVKDVDYDSIADWQAHKRDVERYVDERLEQTLPGISEHFAVRTTATALTSHRFTLNHHGAMLGWTMAPDQLGERRPDVRGPVERLLLTGHWVQPGGGITPVIVSAMRAAEAGLGLLGARSSILEPAAVAMAR